MVKMKHPEETFSKVAYYSLTVVLGLTVHGFGTLPLIYWLITRKNPCKFFRGMLPAFMTAIATASRLAARGGYVAHW